MIISRRKYRHCPLLLYKKLFQQLFAIMHLITGRALFILPTEEFGSMMKALKTYLGKIRAYAIDMETATIFTVGFFNKIPTGALLLVSDSPMVPEGVKTAESDASVTAQFVERHLRIGIESLKQLINNGLTVRHLKF